VHSKVRSPRGRKDQKKDTGKPSPILGRTFASSGGVATEKKGAAFDRRRNGVGRQRPRSLKGALVAGVEGRDYDGERGLSKENSAKEKLTQGFWSLTRCFSGLGVGKGSSLARLSKSLAKKERSSRVFWGSIPRLRSSKHSRFEEEGRTEGGRHRCRL